MIQGLELILSEELRENLIKLREDLIRHYRLGRFNADLELLTVDRLKIDNTLYNHVMGIGVPISISDGWSIHLPNGGFEIRIAIDYKVFSGYKPYQDEDLVHLNFKIDQNVIRTYKIEQIIS